VEEKLRQMEALVDEKFGGPALLEGYLAAAARAGDAVEEEEEEEAVEAEEEEPADSLLPPPPPPPHWGAAAVNDSAGAARQRPGGATAEEAEAEEIQPVLRLGGLDVLLRRQPGDTLSVAVGTATTGCAAAAATADGGTVCLPASFWVDVWLSWVYRREGPRSALADDGSTASVHGMIGRGGGQAAAGEPGDELSSSSSSSSGLKEARRVLEGWAGVLAAAPSPSTEAPRSRHTASNHGGTEGTGGDASDDDLDSLPAAFEEALLGQ
jgi:hypothetical protein